MTLERARYILDEAESLHGRGASVDQDRIGVVLFDGAVWHVNVEIWIAMRAILIGRGFALERQCK